VGIDPSVEAAAYARRAGLDVRAEAWEDFWPSRYDAITAFWLLEHLPNAFDFLRWCRRHLNDGGVLCLAVPNDFSSGQHAVNDSVGRPYYWVHPTHALYLTPATLGNLLGRAGFRLVDIIATFPMEKFLMDGRDYTIDDAVGAACHAEVRALELRLTREQRLDVMRDYGRRGHGRDLIVFATVE
jgi:predicted SAM-dependent methyltransferase